MGLPSLGTLPLMSNTPSKLRPTALTNPPSSTLVQTLIHAVAGCIWIVLSACASSSPQGSASASSPAAASIEVKVHDLTNQYRSSLGLGTLQRNRVLDRLARQHCEHLRKNRGTFSLYGADVSHVGSDGRMAAAAHELGIQHLSEIVACGAPTQGESAAAQRLMALWKSSRKHDAAIRAAPWTHHGVGVVVDQDGTTFSTQLFCTMSLGHMRPTERFNRY